MSNTTIETSSAKRSVVARAAKSAVGEYIGDMVAWDFESFSARRDVVRALFAKHGFAGIVSNEDIDISSALSAAASGGRGVKFGRGVVAEPFKRPRKDTPISIGIYFRQTIDGEGGDEFTPVSRVRVESGRAVARPPEGKSAYDGPRAEQVAQNLAERANEIAVSVDNIELSQALVAAGKRTWWSAFRSKGGAWFVHASQTAKLRGLLDDLEQFGGFYPIVQPLNVDAEGRSERNATRAVAGTLEAELKRLSDDLAKATDVGMQNRAIETRLSDCDDLVVRAELYRDLLAEKSIEIAVAAAAIKARFTKALDGRDDLFDDITAKVGGFATAIDSAVFTPDATGEGENDLFDL